MPHIPGHRGSNAFTGFENIRQRMEGLTPPGPSPIPYRMIGLPDRQATPEEIRIPQAPDPGEGMLPTRPFIPPSRPLPMTPVPLPPPFPMPEYRPPRGFQPPPWINEEIPLPPPVPMPEYRPPGGWPSNPPPAPMPEYRPPGGWPSNPLPDPMPQMPGPGGFLPQLVRPTVRPKYLPPVQSIIERIQQSPEYLQNLYSGPNWTPLTPSFVPNTFVPGGRSGTVPPRFGRRSMRLAGLGAPLY